MIILALLMLYAVSNDGVQVAIRHLVIEGSSQWIVGRNVTRNCDIVPTDGNYLLMNGRSRIFLVDYDIHSYAPYEAFCTNNVDQSEQKIPAPWHGREFS